MQVQTHKIDSRLEVVFLAKMHLKQINRLQLEGIQSKKNELFPQFVV